MTETDTIQTSSGFPTYLYAWNAAEARIAEVPQRRRLAIKAVRAMGPGWDLKTERDGECS